MPNINITLEKQLHAKLKSKCANQQKKMKVVIVELITKFVR